MLASCILRSVVAPCNLLLLSPTPTTRFFLGYPLLVSCSNPPKRFSSRRSSRRSTSGFRVACGLLPVDPWSPDVDSQSIASQLFAVSLFPYLGFLYYITRSKTAPKLTLFGFYFLLAFVGATRIYGNFLSETSSSHVFANLFGVGMKGYHFSSTAKVHYGTSLSNVDWLHGAAESLLTFTNLFIVLGLMGALRKIKDGKKNNPSVDSKVEEKTSI